MITNNNVLVFNFGNNLNFMYKIIKTFLDKKSDKKSLVFRKDLSYKESKDNKYEIIDFDEKELTEPFEEILGKFISEIKTKYGK